uniref:Uncharacterized protein n=1 Tax=Arundo donax TaxID=35708 RepID=A0A0A8Z671_ARUDO
MHCPASYIYIIQSTS